MEQHLSKYPSTFYRVSLKAIIRNEKGEVLLVKEYDAIDWSLPGGGWDHGEAEHEALARELREETGFQGNFTSRPVATAVFWTESKQVWLLWIVYEVEPDNKNFVVGEWSNDVAFVDPRQLKHSGHRTERWIYDFLVAN